MSDADFLQGLREAEDRAERMRAAREAAADGPSALLNHRVRIEGLTGRADLNGRHGLARTFVADKGRYAVQVETRRPRQRGQPPATASEPEHVLLKPANLVSIGHVSAVRADFRARQAALEALIKPASGVELQIGGRGVDLEELRSRVDKARELIDLLPLVDDGVPLAEYDAVAFHRRVLGLSSDPPSGLRLRAFGQLKCSLLTLAEKLEELERFADAQPMYAELTAMAIEEEAELFGDPSQVSTSHNNEALCFKRQGLFAEAIECYRAGVAVVEAGLASGLGNKKLLENSLGCLKRNMEAAQARLATHVAPEGGAEYAPRSIPVMTKEKGPRAAKRLREEGNDAYRSQRYNEAIKWYTAALAADESAAPLERAKVHCNLSACYKEMGDWQTASKEAARAIDAAPDFVKGHVRLGLATIDSQPQKAADAFQEALRLDPSNEAYEKYLDEARANLEKYEKADANEMSVGEAQAQGIGYKMVQAWRTSPLGVLDVLIGTHGKEAVLEGSPYLKSLHDAWEGWHDGMRVALEYVAAGAIVMKAQRGECNFPHFPNHRLKPERSQELKALTLLTDAIWRFDQVSFSCPMLTMHIDGKLYYNEQLQFATQGLITTAQSRHKIMNDGMPPFEIRAAVAKTDLTDPIARDALEATIRIKALHGHVSAQILAAAGSQMTRNEAGDEIEKLHLALSEADLWRRCAVIRAFRQFGSDEMVAALPPLEGGQEQVDIPIPEMRAVARDLLVEAGAKTLADAVCGAGLSVQLLAVAQKLMHFMPDGLDSYGVLIDAALEEFKGEDPGILLKAAWLEFECAYYKDSQTVQVERQGSYHKAAEYYSNAVAAARKPTGQGYRLSDLIWESANALGYAGGADDHLGVTLGELRAKCREAEAAQAVERGIYDGMPGETTGQAETAVRSVLEAKATLMPEERVLRTEYRELVGKAWKAAVEKVEKVIKVGKREGPSGPMWVPGRAPDWDGSGASSWSDRAAHLDVKPVLVYEESE